MGRLPDGWLLGAAAAWALALMLAITQPMASLAWLAEEHATIEQVVLHEEALERGYADHHAAHDATPTRCGVCEEAELVPVRLGLTLSLAATWAVPFHDALQGALTELPDVAATDGAWRLDPSANNLFWQHFPLVPHRPPICT